MPLTSVLQTRHTKYIDQFVSGTNAFRGQMNRSLTTQILGLMPLPLESFC